MKKGVLILLSCILLISASVMAQNKLDISPIKEKYSPGENITLRVYLLDSNNMPINDSISLVIVDPLKVVIIEQDIQSNKMAEIDLGENPTAGYWQVQAKYQTENKTIESTSLFFIDSIELAKFELNGDILTITNIGNSRYSKTVSIIIGSSVGTKDIDLLIEEKKSLRLTGDGDYNVRITDGKTTISREKVSLTGEAIGVLDEKLEKGVSGITGGIGKSSIMDNSFIYIFLIIIFAAGILLSIERKYRKKLGKLK